MYKSEFMDEFTKFVNLNNRIDELELLEVFLNEKLKNRKFVIIK